MRSFCIIRQAHLKITFTNTEPWHQQKVRIHIFTKAQVHHMRVIQGNTLSHSAITRVRVVRTLTNHNSNSIGGLIWQRAQTQGALWSQMKQWPIWFAKPPIDEFLLVYDACLQLIRLFHDPRNCFFWFVYSQNPQYLQSSVRNRQMSCLACNIMILYKNTDAEQTWNVVILLEEILSGSPRTLLNAYEKRSNSHLSPSCWRSLVSNLS